MKKIITLVSIIISTLVFSGVTQAKISDKAEIKNKVHKNRIIVVKSAKKYLGVKYVFGGESHYGLDCSGLTKVVYAKVNKYLPHFAAAQKYIGKLVTHYKLRPGDLLFYNNGGHVALYIGSNRMIHASSYSGRVVNVEVRRGWEAARRILYS